MKKVAIILNIPDSYTGGLNYYKNLLYSINKVNNDSIKILLFISNTLDEEYVEYFIKHSTVIKTKFINSNNFLSIINKIIFELTNISIYNEYLIKKYNVDLITHSYYVPKFSNIKVSNWIPDFQYIHYPELWTKRELELTLKHHRHLVKNSDSILLSSYDALKDFELIFPEYKFKTKVINFVSQPSKEFNSNKEAIYDSVSKYTLGKLYFYLPNQFWQHKNHMAALEAANILHLKGYDFKLICSGYMKDFRNSNFHIQKILDFVRDNDLNEKVSFLGLIPYEDVLNLIYFSKALINPSFFEGWSSTVEEAKSIGTLSIISDIPIHREQSPKNVIYFDPNDSVNLAEILENILLNGNKYLKIPINNVLEDLELRTLKFGNELIDYYTNHID
jgi:hypothetical protein